MALDPKKNPYLTSKEEMRCKYLLFLHQKRKAGLLQMMQLEVTQELDQKDTLARGEH